MTSSNCSPAAEPNEFTVKASEVKSSRLSNKKVPLIDKDDIPLNKPISLSSESIQRLDPFLRRVLQRMPADVATTFSERQVQALQIAISQPSRHALDVRRSLSFFCWRCYFVILAGPERRIPARVKKSRRPWSAASTALVTLLLLAFGLTLYQVSYRRLLQPRAPKVVVEPTGEAHPAALPWIEKPEDCRGAQRQWKDGMCYDSEHSPKF